jgi:hypothetical protein
MQVYQAYLNGKKTRSPEDLRDIHVCEFCDWRHSVIQQREDQGTTRPRPVQDVRGGRLRRNLSTPESGTSRWSDAYHGMSSAVADGPSEVGSNHDLSEVSSVLETPESRHA